MERHFDHGAQALCLISSTAIGMPVVFNPEGTDFILYENEDRGRIALRLLDRAAQCQQR